MRKVLIYSILLIAGLIASQALPAALGDAFDDAHPPIKLATMFCLSFIMIHVGYEFEIDKSNPRKYAWDYIVAATAAAFPWIFCALYFVFVMAPRPMWGSYNLWVDTLLESRFASPTSAGVLFSMLAAAGLAATWVFKKARVLAIFDDLDTVLLMIPLKMMIVGVRWQLGVIILIMAVLLWLAWKYLHQWRIPISWPWVFLYAGLIALGCEGIFLLSEEIDPDVPIHLEVLLPAFVLGCMLARPRGARPHSDDASEEAEQGPESPSEQRVSTLISAAFMVLVGLSMPSILGDKPHAEHAPQVSSQVGPPTGAAPVDHEDPVEHEVARYGVPREAVEEHKAFPGWGVIAVHVLLVTLISNLGKMFPALCYRREATLKERLALSVGMFPRGEVGAGVLVISLSYGISGNALIVAMLSLALNLLCTGLFIVIVKRLIADVPPRPQTAAA